MNKLSVSVLMAMFLATSTLAEVPVYRDQAIFIKEALVVTESGTSYYANIKLQANSDGSFELVQAERLEPVYVEEVAVEVGQSQPVQVSVQVSGYLPNPCAKLEEPAVMREGSTFTIVLAQRALQTFAACPQVSEPFTVFVPLNVKGLQAGHYTAVVNDKPSGFDLAVPD